MKPQQRKMLAGAIFFAGGPLLCLLAVGVEALAGFGWLWMGHDCGDYRAFNY
jgi:hypothetical protein